MIIEFYDYNGEPGLNCIYVQRNVDVVPEVGEQVTLRGSEMDGTKLVMSKKTNEYVVVRRRWNFDPQSYHREPSVRLDVTNKLTSGIYDTIRYNKTMQSY